MITLKNIFKIFKGNNLSGQIDRAKCFGEDLKYSGPFKYNDQGVNNVELNQVVGKSSLLLTHL